jgi:hypothetical protein
MERKSWGEERKGNERRREEVRSEVEEVQHGEEEVRSGKERKSLAKCFVNFYFEIFALMKGTVAQDFLLFFYQTTFPSPLRHA